MPSGHEGASTHSATVTRHEPSGHRVGAETGQWRGLGQFSRLGTHEPSGQVRAGAAHGWNTGHCRAVARHERSGQSTGAEGVQTTLAGQGRPASTQEPSGHRVGQVTRAARAAVAATSPLHDSGVRHSLPSHETVPNGQVGSVGHDARLVAQDSSAGQRTSPTGQLRAAGHAAMAATHWLLAHRTGRSGDVHTTGLAHDDWELAQAKLGHVAAGHDTMGAHSPTEKAQVPSVQRTSPAWQIAPVPAVAGHENPRLSGLHSSLPSAGQRVQPRPLLRVMIARRSAEVRACQGTRSVSLYSHEHICGFSTSHGVNTGHSV